MGLAVGLLVQILGALPAHAAFPGADGRLVFERETPAGDHTQTDLYTIRPDGTGLKRLTFSANQNEFGASWNATGTRIAFWRTPAPFGPGSIWVMNADGTHKRQLTSGFDARDPVWNPAGTRLAFTLVQGGAWDLWTLRVSDGGDLQSLTSDSATLDFEPAWSPDGTRIAFTRGSAEGDPGDIYLLDVATRNVLSITSSPAYDHQVTWGPGGGRLFFQREVTSSSSIYRVDADGSRLVPLTSGSFFDMGPAVSPSGRFVAFGSDRSGGFFHDLWMMNVDGSNKHVIRQLDFSENFPDWQPRAG